MSEFPLKRYLEWGGSVGAVCGLALLCSCGSAGRLGSGKGDLTTALEAGSGAKDSRGGVESEPIEKAGPGGGEGGGLAENSEAAPNRVGVEKVAGETLYPKNGVESEDREGGHWTLVDGAISVDDEVPVYRSISVYRELDGHSRVAQEFDFFEEPVVETGREEMLPAVVNVFSTGGEAGGEEPDGPAEEIFYTVRPGDSLYSISRKFEIAVAELKRLNRLESDVLEPSQRLRVK